MALKAQRPHVGEIALAAAFHYRHNVVGVPQMAPAAPIFFELAARAVIQLALILAQRLRVYAALRAHPTVAREDLLAQVSGIGAKLPFMHTRTAAESESPFRNSQTAPAAQTFLAPRNPSPGLGAAGAR
jgi:hypothetical protein